MHASRMWATLGGALGAGLCLVGCGGPTMTVPADIAGASDQIPITERSSFSGALADESFVMGDFEIKDVDRDWNSTSSSGIAGYSSSDTAGGYSYKFVAEGEEITGTCVTAVDKKGASVAGIEIGSQNASVGCECASSDPKTVLRMASKHEGEYGGELTTSATSYNVKAIYDRDGGFSDGKPSGYRVDGDGPVGAVDVLKPGKVWLGKQLEVTERRELACIFAGLLLYEPPKD